MKEKQHTNTEILLKYWKNNTESFVKKGIIIFKINQSYKKKYRESYNRIKDFINNSVPMELIITCVNGPDFVKNEDKLQYARYFVDNINNLLLFGDLLDYTKYKKFYNELNCDIDHPSKEELDYRNSLLKNKKN
ncbi:MAG: hypothetical protein KatS3mg129_1759 [Leptospiraceae bacterium]|nr:MAG: hypothetical protein KatS3mg129_1759 [Leptospiraceae bacterium]